MLKIRILAMAPKAACLVVPVAEGAPPPQATLAAAQADDFTGQAGEVCEAFLSAGRVLLVGLGPVGVAPEMAWHAAGARAAARLAMLPRIAIDAAGIAPALVAAFAAGACLRAWRTDRLRTRPDPDVPRLAALDILAPTAAARQAVATAWQPEVAAVQGTLLARELVAEPSDTLTPSGFVARLRTLTRHGLELTVLKRADLARAEMGALLAVGGGSVHAPRLAVLRWKGQIDAAPVAFVGKGITFDTGGICIKPADRMWEMRADMAGAAACVGAMLALALRNFAAPAVAVLPLAENATGAASYRPGDVLKTFSGRSVEVVDTDAEGRLVLADALAWVIRHHQPQAIVDLATLTGSIIVALGHEMAGLFDNDPALAAHVAAAGTAVGENAWRMPIGPGHRAALDSAIADLRHCVSERFQPDACQAAAFLREFVGDTPSVHLDIAGMDAVETADDRRAQGPTGFGVRLLDRLVATRFEDPHRA